MYAMAGPDVPEGRVVEQCVSHVDLFPTILAAVGTDLSENDKDLPGRSLWPAIYGDEGQRTVFAEYHAMGSRNSGFAVRTGDYKLIYHVGMPNQLFDLAADPREENDLLVDGNDLPRAAELERQLRQLINPEEVDARSKADQWSHMEKFGGVDEVRKAGVFSVSPVPGKAPKLEHI